MPVGYLCPVRHACATKGVSADVDARVPDTSDVNDVGQIIDVRAEEVVCRCRRVSSRKRDPSHSLKTGLDIRVGGVGDHGRCIRVSGPSVWRVVLEAAVAWRIV